MTSDRITLTVPARGEYAKTVRMTAAALASRVGMSFDEVDDVRLAAEEAFVYAAECAGPDNELTFAFTVSDDALEVAVGPLPERCVHAGKDVSEGYAEFILQSICDEFSIAHEADACMLRLCRRMSGSAEGTGA